ncbi:uncharacterized protein LOC117337773 [Pecten maximus]|uniref:uncharacterized protein LOC117337773 n=1 Tax=Pecten maximus TaxID=6579 RepID=UPI0014590A83|nr:uncharacterized protein LOC117337773 [Pecten maximus]
MDNKNNNQVIDGEEWPNDVFGFLRVKRSSGLNLWVTFLEDKVVLNDKTEERRGYPELAKQNKVDEKENGFYDEDYNPYVMVFADDIDDWGLCDEMPEAWRL